jgi:hypothetical protein
MGRKMNQSRRQFLKTTAIGAAGMAISGGVQKAFAAPFKAINANIPNTRIICCNDAKMLSGSGSTSFQSQNQAIALAPVEADLDAMAMSLTQQASTALAWSTIFRSSKSWATTKVAIKVNCLNGNFYPHVAIVAKICKVLGPQGLGVPYSQIIIYDGCTSASGVYRNYVGTNSPGTGYTGAKIPAGVLVADGNGTTALPFYDTTQNGTQNVAVTGQGSPACTKAIANGTVDILVNCAINKGHSNWNGNATLCMKNHYGTFDPHGGNNNHGAPDYLLAINASDPIVGGTPIRQQLCIVDSLWGAKTGPSSPPDSTPYNRLVMGTFAPIVDYCVCKYIRSALQGQTYASGSTEYTSQQRFLTDFGYTTSDPQWIEISGATAVRESFGNENSQKCIFSVDGARVESSVIDLKVNGKIQSALIYDINGALVTEVGPNGGNRLSWNGLANGRPVNSGTYIIKLVSGNSVVSKSFKLLTL